MKSIFHSKILPGRAKKTRIAGLDILRTLAIIFVMLTHLISYRYVNILDNQTGTAQWYICALARFTVILSIPIFLLLSGYLLSSRRPDRSHAAAIIPVMFSWFVLSFAATFAERFLFGTGDVRTLHAILKIFNFNFGYTWYVEMYLCLYLVMPYLNLLLDRLERRGQQRLIAVLAFLTLVPAVLRSFKFDGVWIDILPDYFEVGYAITYFLIGGYIARHKPKPRPIYCIGTLAAVLIFELVLYRCFSQEGESAWWIFREYNTLTHAIAAVALFLLFYRVGQLPGVLAIPIREISVCSFEMYLISYLTDRIFYSPEQISNAPTFLLSLSRLKSWQAFICNFVTVYLAARILRLVLVPISGKLRAIAAGKKTEKVGK